MGHLNVLILGDSRILPRQFEGKKAHLEPKLSALLKKNFPQINFNLKTIAAPNKLLREVKSDHKAILDFFPDIIIVCLNLCDFIPRSLPKPLFNLLEANTSRHPKLTNNIRALLANNRRLIHKILGKNSWNSRRGYAKDLDAQLSFLRKITDRIVYLDCLQTSVGSEHIRPGFQKDIAIFNQLSKQIATKHGLFFLESNALLENNAYDNISHDGIHYSDLGDDLVAKHIFDNYLKKEVSEILQKNLSVNFPVKPKYIQVELTNHCSVKCTMCELNHCTRDKGYMPKPVFLEFLKQLKEWEIPLIRFTLWGEALMHPDFMDFLRISKEKGFKTSLNTNGVLLTENLLKDLLKIGLDYIIFSVDSFDDNNIFKSFRSSQKRIEDVNSAILKLIRLKKEINSEYPYVYIQMIGTQTNESQHDKFLNFWTPIVDSCRITHLYSMRPISDYDKEKIREYDYFYECRYPWTTMGVYHNGDVTACCRDVNGALFLGNIMKTKLSELYESPFLKAMRKNLIMKNKPLCRSYAGVALSIYI